MAARIPENKIDEIRTATDIVEIISGYVALKKRGRNFLGLCPFHSEKTPSFSVSPEKQIYHCFGCGKGGNVFSFLMEHEKLSFIEAITQLADRYGIILPKYEQEPDSRTERLLFANEMAAKYFQAGLKDPRYRTKMEWYLHEKRGLTPEIIEKFRIGLAPDDWEGFINFARKKDLTPQILEEAGLATMSEKTGRHVDRFRLRLMMPIFNITGKIVGFGGRALRKSDRAKYVNSPETPLYSKSFILYGLHAAKQAIRDSGAAILVEGYFDFLSLFQAGIHNVVAVSGTAFTPQQARLLARFAHKAYLFFDADSAGRSASLRSMENFYNAGIEPWVVTPPPGHDPDSLAREQGPEAIHKLLENALDYLSFRFEGIDFGQLSINEKEALAREVSSLAQKIDDDLKRNIFISSAADKMHLPITALQPGRVRVPAEQNMTGAVRDVNILESELLSLFVTRPALIELVWNELSPDDFRGPGHGDLYRLMTTTYRETNDINPQKMMDEIGDETLSTGLACIATFDWADIDLTGVTREYKRRLLRDKRDRKLAELKAQLGEAEKRGDREAAQKLTLEIKYLLDKRS